MGTVILQGWLYKKKKEGKSSLLGSKWGRRWFELTDETFAYTKAKDAKDVKNAKESDIEFFSVHEMQKVTRVDEIKFEVKFPERVLRLRAESPGEADRWVQAMEKAWKDATQPQSMGMPQPRVAEAIRKNHIITAMTIEADSDDDEPPPQKPIQLQPSASGRLGPLPRPVSPPRMPAGRGMDQDTNSNRPPSPRSLLANPRIGAAIIATPAKPQREDESLYADVHEPVQSWAHAQDDDEEDEDEQEERERQAAAVAARMAAEREAAAREEAEARAAAARAVAARAAALPPSAPLPRSDLAMQQREREEAAAPRFASPAAATRSNPANQPHPLRNAMSMAHRGPAAERVVLDDDAGPGSGSGTPKAGAGRAAANAAASMVAAASLAAPDRASPRTMGRSQTVAPRAPAPKAEVLMLDTPAPAPAGSVHTSRPGSNASSRPSTSRASQRDDPMDGRIELTPPAGYGSRGNSAGKPPAAPSSGARIGSAGSNQGMGGGASSARAQSAGSAYGGLGPAPSSNLGTETDENWLEDDWDSSDSGEHDDDSAMNQRHHNSSGSSHPQGGSRSGAAARFRAPAAAAVDEGEDEAGGEMVSLASRRPAAGKAGAGASPAGHKAQVQAQQQQQQGNNTSASWDEDDSAEAHHQPHHPQARAVQAQAKARMAPPAAAAPAFDEEEEEEDPHRHLDPALRPDANFADDDWDDE